MMAADRGGPAQERTRASVLGRTIHTFERTPFEKFHGFRGAQGRTIPTLRPENPSHKLAWSKPQGQPCFLPALHPC